MIWIIVLAYWLIGVVVLFAHNWALCGGRSFGWSLRNNKWWWFLPLAFLWPIVVVRFGK